MFKVLVINFYNIFIQLLNSLTNKFIKFNRKLKTLYNGSFSQN